VQKKIRIDKGLTDTPWNGVGNRPFLTPVCHIRIIPHLLRAHSLDVITLFIFSVADSIG